MMRRFLVTLLLTFGFSITIFCQPVIENSPTGFASVNALGQNGTNGGKGGNVITITNADTLYKYLRNLRPDKNPSLPPTIFEITGTINKGGDKMIYLKGNANITFIGRGNKARFVGFGLKIQDNSHNIIIRNIEFADSPDDGICIESGSHHIWVDHCSFTNAYDGCIDVKTQSRYVTISWCRFYKHSKTCLFGHDDGETADTIMTATYHHCWWDSTLQRHPRVRYGRVHVYNNYYTNNSLYGIASTCNGKVVSEANYFKNLPYPCHIGYAESPAGFLNDTNNIYENCGTPLTNGEDKFLGTPKTNRHSWNPENDYAYIADDPAILPDMIQAYTGSGKIDFFSTTNVNDNLTNQPVGFITLQNYPNPFNPSTIINYQLSVADYATLKIFDIMGREIATLVNENKSAGNYEIKFNVSGLGSGIYFAVLTTSTKKSTIKLVVMK